METCVFCRSKLDIVFENETCFAIFDRNPVTQGHLLILPKAHREDYFSLTERELADTDKLVKLGKKYLDQRYAPQGYNIGFNYGVVAGQTILHCHCHLIPRCQGDVADPKGGVRGVIPAKQKY
ncbi:HIT family protein [Enterococcus asini]|nr:HIT family protein [Enterococcus asini]MDT2809733.1 HIT family protein [Enterococcus asini]RGW14489.1 HIT family protein [Enterococcus asini]